MRRTCSQWKLAKILTERQLQRSGFDGRLPKVPVEARSDERTIVQAARKDLWSAIEAGKLSLPIDKTFPLAQAAEALAHMKANAHFGKIVLVV